jgi:hypothetical protein
MFTNSTLPQLATYFKHVLYSPTALINNPVASKRELGLKPY